VGNRRRTYKATMRRVTISISDGLLDMVDEAARQDFTTRSDLIRMAVLWYLRPQGRELTHMDPEEIFKTLQHRKTRTAIKQTMQDAGLLPKPKGFC